MINLKEIIMTEKHEGMYIHETIVLNGREVKVSRIKPEYLTTLEEFEAFLKPIARKVARRQMREEEMKKQRKAS